MANGLVNNLPARVRQRSNYLKLAFFFAEIKCPKLRPPQYGKIYTSGYYPGDYAAYDCNYGYKLVGKRRRLCLHSGSWSGSDYDCIKEQGHGYGYGHQSY